VGLGTICGVLALVRPNFALVVVPVAVLASWRPGTRRRTAWATGALVALPAVLLIGGYATANGVRFDSYGLTPLLPYHLSAKTAPYVEELPASDEPARSVLIEARDAALLRGESMAPENFIWAARPRLAEATGLDERELDALVLELDLRLITQNPYAYLDTVKVASVDYVDIDSQPAILGLGRPVAWAQQALHHLLLGAFVVLVGAIPGLALAGAVDRSRLRVLVVALVLGSYTWLSAVATESGTARLRAPSEPLLALAFVVSASVVRRAWRARRSQALAET
jgi:hypothetical protein